MTFQEGTKCLPDFPKTALYNFLCSISKSQDKIAPSVQSDGDKNPSALLACFSQVKDYLKCLNLLSHSVQASEARKANGRGAELHRGEQGVSWLGYTPAAPPQPQLLCMEVLPHWFFSGFFSEASIRINPTGVISITTDRGSAAFVPEYGFLHASSLKEMYKNNTKKTQHSFAQSACVVPRGNAILIEASWHHHNSHIAAP